MRAPQAIKKKKKFFCSNLQSQEVNSYMQSFFNCQQYCSLPSDQFFFLGGGRGGEGVCLFETMPSDRPRAFKKSKVLKSTGMIYRVLLSCLLKLMVCQPIQFRAFSKEKKKKRRRIFDFTCPVFNRHFLPVRKSNYNKL